MICAEFTDVGATDAVRVGDFIDVFVTVGTMGSNVRVGVSVGVNEIVAASVAVGVGDFRIVEQPSRATEVTRM